MKEVTSTARVIGIVMNNVVDYSKVDIELTTENAVKAVRKKVTGIRLLDFCLCCRNFLQAVVSKLLSKTSIQYPLANNL